MPSSFCTGCGTKLEPGSRFCASCGTAVQGDPAPLAPAQVHAPVAAAPVFRAPPAAPYQPAVHHSTVVIASTKSVGIALILSILFGPLGLLYATVSGGVIMFFVSIFAALFTFGIGLFITWPICVIWSAIAASNHNKSLMAAHSVGQTT